MNRRTFLKRVGGTIVGFVAFLIMPKKVSAEQGECNVIIANNIDEIRKWSKPNSIDFSPDTIVAIENFRGRLLIFCKHSVWEIEEDWDGKGLVRKQLSCMSGLTYKDSEYHGLVEKV